MRRTRYTVNGNATSLGGCLVAGVGIILLNIVIWGALIVGAVWLGVTALRWMGVLPPA